jgi:predicted dithiol-disulfide oxidoreductase (DUF899 family)
MTEFEAQFRETKERGWDGVRVVSAAGTNRDYHGKTPDGRDSTMMNVFRREQATGKVRHFWGSELAWAKMDPGQDPRHVDLVNPIFNMLDFTPEGRGDFSTKLRY